MSAIRPNARQPRNSFPEAGIRELAASIKEVGILQPLVVRSTPAGFELIAGERRLRAAREAGLDRVPVLIRQAGENESMELALVENLQRENLSPLETAAAYQALMDGFGLTKDQLARRLGKSRAAVTNTLRLVHLPEEIQTLLARGEALRRTRPRPARPRDRRADDRAGPEGRGREALRQEDRGTRPRSARQLHPPYPNKAARLQRSSTRPRASSAKPSTCR